MTVRILNGRCELVLPQLIDQGVRPNCVVTSPPYWGLRDYDVPGQLGLETSVDEYIEKMVRVFRVVRRMLADDGTLWLNMGDSYIGGMHRNSEINNRNSTLEGGRATQDAARETPNVKTSWRRDRAQVFVRSGSHKHSEGLKYKDLVGVPWMLAFALRADGWYLRQDIIWHKKNPMPESVRDRCTKAHEYVFLLSKSRRYYFDQAAIAEDSSDNSHARVPANGKGDGVNPKAAQHPVAGWANGTGVKHNAVEHARSSKTEGRAARDIRDGTKFGRGPGWRVKQNESFSSSTTQLVAKRNKRSVWSLVTEPYTEAHFATFPTTLVEPCILAGCPPGGIVLDPFSGSGTTGLVAETLQRDAVLIELKREYAAMSDRRIHGSLFASVA